MNLADEKKKVSMCVIYLKKIFISLLAAVITSFTWAVVVLAQSPTPTIGTQIDSAPPGDTTILLLAAGVLVLIVLGGVLWQARVRK